MAEVSAAKLKRGQPNVCTVIRTMYSFPLTAEICAGLAGNFRQYLATVTSVANDMVWLTVCYFTASSQGGRGEGEWGNRYHTARIPSPFPLRVAKTGRNHLNEEFTPLLPTGIGERF
jgi:hypothetical protein